MKIEDSENLTMGEVFKYELFYSIRRFYQENAADRFVESIFDEVVNIRKGVLGNKEFREIVERILPNSSIKKDAIKELAEQFEICSGGACINMCHQRPTESGRGIIPDEEPELGSNEEAEEDSFWADGCFIETIDPNDNAKMRTFHMKHDEEMNYSCRKCKAKISAHNKDWHGGMCDECFGGW